MRYLLTAILIPILASSCIKNKLEITPADRISDAVLWTDANSVNLFLNDIYNNLNPGPIVSTWLYLPSQISNDPLENFTDNASSGPVAGIPSHQLFDNASFGPSNELFGRTWSMMFQNIRKCNLLISKVSESSFADNQKKTLIAQARFLRAHFYKTLVDLYGGVPLVTDVLSIEEQGEGIYQSRNTAEECNAFIEKESELAAADLPKKWTGQDIGRATWGAAMAMKGEQELYTGKWSAAANTNDLIMKSAQYSLFPDLEGLFYMQNENNQEIIFDVQYAPTVRSVKTNQYWGAIWAQKGSGWGGTCPTQTLVDEFEYTDGKTAQEGSTMYNPLEPYKNQSKRFYATILYDGMIWQGKNYYTRVGLQNNYNQFTSGVSGNGNPTGYGVKKTMDSTIAPTPGVLDGRNAVIYRYAEVLLNYAEAKNELSGPDESVYAAINLVRKRAGLPDLPSALPQAEMRKKIRRERRVELAFEGKYFYDMRRWRICEEAFGKDIVGMKISMAGNTLKYERTNIRKIVFDPSKHYLMPVPQSAIDKNQKLTQNQGYK